MLFEENEVEEVEETQEVEETEEVEAAEETKETVLGIEEILGNNNNWDIEDEITITEDKEVEEGLEIPHYVLSEVSTSLETLENMMNDEPSKEISFENNEPLKEIPFEDDEPVAPLYNLEGDYQANANQDNKFDQQQNEFLSGKTVLKDIISEDGEMIVKTGDFVDEEIIKRAKKKGKLIEIIMNLKQS